MKKMKMHFFGKLLCIVASILFVLPPNGTLLFGATDPNPSIEFGYDPIEYFVPGKRIVLEIEANDKSGINLVRCYFRAGGQKDYVFVPMTAVKEGTYRAILPASSKDTSMIDYLFLVVNGKNQVFKTQTFIVKEKDEKDVPAWQLSDTEGNILLYTELPEASQPPVGFSDSIAMDLVESSARFGIVVGGIYAVTQRASADPISGDAAAATSGGTVTASSGLSTGAKVGIGVGISAVIGGGAAALGGGGGGDDASSLQPQPTTTTTTTSTTTSTTSTSTSTSTTTTTVSTSTTTRPTTTTTSTTSTTTRPTTTTTSTTTTIPNVCPDSARLENYPDFSVVCGTDISGLSIITEPPRQGVRISWQYGTNQGGTSVTDQNGRIVFAVTVNNTSDRLNWQLPDCGIQGGGMGFLCNSLL